MTAHLVRIGLALLAAVLAVLGMYASKNRQYGVSAALSLLGMAIACSVLLSF